MNSRKKQECSSIRGFSIIELMSAMMTLAIVVSVSYPQIEQSLADYRLSNSATMVASELMAARSMAISRANIHEVTCNTSDGTMQVIDTNDANNTPRGQKSLYSGISFSTIPSPNILFYSRGLARGGTIVLQNALGNTKTVIVTAGGDITIN